LEFFRATVSFHEKFSLQYSVSNVLNISYTAHDALEDSKVLQRLTELPQHAVEDNVLKYTFDISSTCAILSLQVQSKKTYETLKPLLVHSVVSDNMAKNITVWFVLQTSSACFQEESSGGNQRPLYRVNK
jgi:hypothetical protein